MSSSNPSDTYRAEAREIGERASAFALSAMPTDLPAKAETPGQAALEAKHGTPKVFAEACARAVGEISINQAVDAVERYAAEWRAA